MGEEESKILICFTYMLSVGEILSKERLKKGLTLKQVEKDLRVREKFLKDIEANNWNNFSSKIYITGIIKNYSLYLGLDPNKSIRFFRRDYERKEEVEFKKTPSAVYFKPETKRIVLIGIISIFIIFFSYFGYQLLQYFSPPKLTIISPTNTQFHNVDKITITAKTDKDAIVTIFGEREYLDKNGRFQYEFPLKEGQNQLVVEIVGANGRKTTVKQNYVLK